MSNAAHKPKPLKVRYSPSESFLLQLLRQRKQPVRTIDLIDQFYKGRGRTPPFNARSSLFSTIKTLQRKAIINNDTFRVVLSENRGQQPSEVQLERR